ncbi:YbcN family protein [Enterobacter kobei]|uniref:YbcN family protein n=1 Tax=Enterobacter kobei TaxID=208224 RepID=UPI001E2F2393|nr:YbcN family protein [Enterobacter kobei]MCE1354299.1 YbcN family protein [Enterobacter kobei]
MSIPECGIKLHTGNFNAIGKLLQEQLQSGKPLRLQVKEWRDKRSLSQNSLFHMWMGEISEHLINSGRTDATPEWVKRNLKKTYLGCEEVTYTDFITGEKTTTWAPRHTSDLDTGEMHIFLVKVEMWCAQFGLSLTIPNGCEYQQLRDKQEA